MKNCGFYLSFLWIVGCASGGTASTMASFHEIPIGASTTEVEGTAGKPYAIHHKDDGAVEYEYIERIKVGDRNNEIRRYFLIIKNGKVVSKRVEGSSPPAFEFDSYDMQTTQIQE
jgi:hypothetical protein